MYKYTIIFIGILLLVSFTKKQEEVVYICNGPSSQKYHYTKSCRGLKRCSTKIYKVSLEEARNRQRTLCGYED